MYLTSRQGVYKVISSLISSPFLTLFGLIFFPANRIWPTRKKSSLPFPHQLVFFYPKWGGGGTQNFIHPFTQINWEQATSDQIIGTKSKEGNYFFAYYLQIIIEFHLHAQLYLSEYMIMLNKSRRRKIKYLTNGRAREKKVGSLQPRKTWSQKYLKSKHASKQK